MEVAMRIKVTLWKVFKSVHVAVISCIHFGALVNKDLTS
jgi:hypothetical protein